MLAVTLLLLLVSGCSEDAQTDFTDDNREGFLAACSEQFVDDQLTADICQCVFEATQDQMDFDDFESTDESLVEDPLQPLPSEITGFIADCVIEHAEL